MLAEIIAIGSELLGAARLDTNSLYLTRELSALGIQVTRKSVLPDDLETLAAAMEESCRRTPLVLCSGGLGPTEDDRTREAAARALNRPLVRDPIEVERLHAFFAARRRPMADINLRQADCLQGAAWLPNPVGSASGQWCPTEGGLLVLLPGPPPELQAIFAAHVQPRLLPLAPRRAFFTRVLSIVDMPESEVDALVAPLYREYFNPATTILATAAPQVELHFQAWGETSSQAQAAADQLACKVEQRLGAAVFSRERESLAAVVGHLLLQRGETLAVAESCTGGMLGGRLTDEPGSSRYFLGGIIAYSDAVKRELADVSPEILQVQGAVSAACARELAEGIRERLGSDWGLSITGIAGPAGGTSAKPVGTVFIGLSHAGRPTLAHCRHFPGDRERVRRGSVQHALNQLRLLLTTPERALG